MPRVRENGTCTNLEYLYSEPALVPLGEKPKVRRNNLVEGTRHISPVTSV